MTEYSCRLCVRRCVFYFIRVSYGNNNDYNNNNKCIYAHAFKNVYVVSHTRSKRNNARVSLSRRFISFFLHSVRNGYVFFFCKNDSTLKKNISKIFLTPPSPAHSGNVVSWQRATRDEMTEMLSHHNNTRIRICSSIRISSHSDFFETFSCSA